MQTLSQQYDTFLLDIWGVIYAGINPYPGAIECVQHLISLNKNILFLSNAPRPAKIILNTLTQFGLLIPEEMILTSGDVVRNQLLCAESIADCNLKKICYHLGADRNQDILSGITLSLTSDIEKADFILITAYIDEHEDLQQYDTLLQKAALLKLPAICANPDKTVIHGDKLRYCAGMIAEKYQELGGIVYFYGKPHPKIYDMAFQKLQEHAIYPHNRILMIGDTLETDILGANQAKIDSALVLTGNTNLLLAAAKKQDLNLQPLEFLDAVFKKTHITPTWMLEKLSY